MLSSGTRGSRELSWTMVETATWWRIVDKSLLLQTTNWKWYMTYQTEAIPITLSHLRGHSCCKTCKCDFSHSCCAAAADKFSTETGVKIVYSLSNNSTKTCRVNYLLQPESIPVAMKTATAISRNRTSILWSKKNSLCQGQHPPEAITKTRSVARTVLIFLPNGHQ